jgi:AraC-like DNA-binding protein
MTISIDLGFVINPLKPILSLSLDVYETQCAEKHKHPRAQLIYSCKGTMKVMVKDSIWLVSPTQAIWVPSMYEHQVYFLKSNHIRNLFFDSSVLNQLPNKCFALDVSPFLRELILRVVNIGDNYNLDSLEGRLIKVLIDELAQITPTKNRLPISNEFHVKKIMDALINDPSDKRNIEDFAGLACTSSRTLARLFIKEAGLTFSEWRKQARLMAAIEKLGNGISVSQISTDLGYNSPSAFIEMFRKEFGLPPTKYLRHEYNNDN